MKLKAVEKGAIFKVENTSTEKLKIMLITNRDSDNTGDKVLETCDIALIQAVMQNLGIQNYEISSYDSYFVFKENAEDCFDNVDIILFGGAPIFNYQYQDFYQRTIDTIEIAEKRNIPVIFSAIGIDSYSEESKECQKLKQAINSDCVKQITTRDGYEFLEQYKCKEQLIIGKVADPAVWSPEVFKNFISPDTHEKKKIGIFVMRAGGFTANGISFSRNKMVNLYKEIAGELENNGYDYEFLTSGHFSDEAFLDYMIRYEKMDESKFVFNINTPEDLVNRVSSYDGIITCRLHPSIVAYSLGIPSVSFVWNSKVEGFYDSIGYQDRMIYTEHVNADSVVSCLEQAMQNGVTVNEDYLMSVYLSLFNGIVLALDNVAYADVSPYTFKELRKYIIPFKGTSASEKEEFLEYKFRRIYADRNRDRIDWYSVIYNSGMNAKEMTYDYDETKGQIKKLDSGSVEYSENDKKTRGGKYKLQKNTFSHPDYTFLGWNMRIKSNQDKWFWLLEDGSFIPKDEWTRDSKSKKIFADGSTIPRFPIKDIKLVVVEAEWRKNEIKILYNSGLRFQKIQWNYSDEEGEVRRLSSGSYEFTPIDSARNDGTDVFKENKFMVTNNCFKGWKLRICIKGKWYWYLRNGTLFPKDEYIEERVGISVKIFADEDRIPYITNKNVSLMVADAVWSENKKKRSIFS